MSKPLQFKVHSVPTRYGGISVTESSTAVTTTIDPDAPALLLLHSNSSCSRCFGPILTSPPAGVSRIIALDYPGHGESDDAGAMDLETTYTQPAYADAAVSVLRALGVRQVIVAGWSLGGHVALEMVARLDSEAKEGEEKEDGKKVTTLAAPLKIRGILITGSPPAGNAAQVLAGFTPGAGECAEARLSSSSSRRSGDNEEGNEQQQQFAAAASYAAAEVWTEEMLDGFVAGCYGQPPYEDWMREMGRRTDGRARRIMFAHFAQGKVSDQVGIVENSDILCAVINGADEEAVNLDYVDGIKFKNLWEGTCHRVDGTGHQLPWEKADTFRDYLSRFIKDCLKS